MRLFLSLVLVFAGQAQAGSLANLGCVPSTTSCEAYSCVENQVKCGASGYVTVGGNLCEAYRASEPNSSEALRVWYPLVRECLQEALLNIDANSCDDLKAKAYQSHVGCYVRTGFCQLGWPERLTILAIAGKDALNFETLQASLQIQQICSVIRY